MPVAPPVTIAMFGSLIAPSRHERQHAQRAARALLDLEWRRDNDGALGGQQVEIGQALQAIAALAVHVEMRGVGGIEVLRLAGVGADRLGSEAESVALLDQPFYDLGRRARGMG